jgi:hypothetical protein
MDSLAHIKLRIHELEAAIVGLGGELPPGSDLERSWDEAQSALMQRADDMAEYVISLRARAEALKDAAKKVIERANAMERHAERVLSYVDHHMDGEEMQGECFTLKRRRNPPSVVITDEWRAKVSCPEAITYGDPLDQGTYQLLLDEHGGTSVVPIKLDKRKLAEALKDGRHIDGAMLHQAHRIVVL